MRKAHVALATFLASILLVGLPGLVTAFIGPPTTFVCNSAAGTISCSWDSVTEASKYSVDVVAQYDTNADTVVDQSLEFDFSTVATTLDISVSADLAHDFGAGPINPSIVTLRVKALNPGKGSGRQNNPFSTAVTLMP